MPLLSSCRLVSNHPFLKCVLVGACIHHHTIEEGWSAKPKSTKAKQAKPSQSRPSRIDEQDRTGRTDGRTTKDFRLFKSVTALTNYNIEYLYMTHPFVISTDVTKLPL